MQRPAGVVRVDRTGGRARFACGSGSCLGFASSSRVSQPGMLLGLLASSHLTRP